MMSGEFSWRLQECILVMLRGILLGGREAWSCYNHLVAIRGDASMLKMASWREEESSLGLVEYCVPYTQNNQTDYLHVTEDESEIQRI